MASYEEIKGRVDARDVAQISKRIRFFLLGSIAFTLAVYFVPYGFIVGLPLIWLSTLAHEVGHGLTAVFVGGTFKKFVMFPDASGAATYSYPEFFGGMRVALIAAGGLVGPAIVAAIGFIAARRAKVAKIALLIGAVSMVLLTILVVRNGFGIGFVLALAGVLALLGTRKNPEVSQIALVFLSTQLATSVFSRGDYLFTEFAETAEGRMPSDVAQMAEALTGPYWLWGGVCGLFSVLVLSLGLWVFLRGFSLPGWLRFGRKA